MKFGKRSKIFGIRGEICKGIVIAGQSQPVHDGESSGFCCGLSHVAVIVLALAGIRILQDRMCDLVNECFYLLFLIQRGFHDDTPFFQRKVSVGGLFIVLE